MDEYVQRLGFAFLLTGGFIAVQQAIVLDRGEFGILLMVFGIGIVAVSPLFSTAD